mmetsp:Transcript_54942/g.101694  ORF Transcript_54942/g.101694 Transcript_54942/m.101694 type:complete len:203 (-) Transcript_54942:144-752(-)
MRSAIFMLTLLIAATGVFAKELEEGAARPRQIRGQAHKEVSVDESQTASGEEGSAASDDEAPPDDQQATAVESLAAVEAHDTLAQGDEQPGGPSPLGDVVPIAPFGKEDTARELTDLAARTQDTLVDAVENAEVAEIKRSVFRSLTRLRAAQIKEFDTIARLETQAIDEYNDNHHYRKENPLDYLHNDEPGVMEDKYTSFHD